MPDSRVVITGTGAVAPEGVAALEPLELPGGGSAPPFGCPVRGFDLKRYLPTVISYLDRCSALALAAVKLALDDAGAPPPPQRRGDWGLAYATAWGCLDSMELFFAKVAAGQARFAPPLIFSHSYANTPASLACIEFGLGGAGATFSQGACGALAALGWARDRLLRSGGAESPGIVVAASDALSKALRRHLAAAGELSPYGRLAPFDPDSAGTVAGEAGAAVTLEPESAAAARGARALAAVRGWGAAAGAEPAGNLERAARAALAEAGAAPADLAAVHADASGRPELDAAEAAALDRAVGRDAPRRTVKSAAGECGPAAALLALAQVCSDPAPGARLVTALDRSGAAALVVERTP